VKKQRSLDDALEQLAARATRGREDDNLQADGKRQAGAEDCNADIAITEGGEESDGDWF